MVVESYHKLKGQEDRAVIEVRAFYGAMGMVVMGRRGFVRTFLDNLAALHL